MDFTLCTCIKHAQKNAEIPVVKVYENERLEYGPRIRGACIRIKIRFYIYLNHRAHLHFMKKILIYLLRIYL